MGYKPQLILRIEVPALDPENPPVFVFGAADNAVTQITVTLGLLKNQGVDIEAMMKDPEQPMASQVMSLLPKAVVEGVRDWENIFDDDGNPVAFSPELLAEIPTHDKITIAQHYLSKLLGLGERKKK